MRGTEIMASGTYGDSEIIAQIITEVNQRKLKDSASEIEQTLSKATGSAGEKLEKRVESRVAKIRTLLETSFTINTPKAELLEAQKLLSLTPSQSEMAARNPKLSKMSEAERERVVQYQKQAEVLREIDKLLKQIDANQSKRTEQRISGNRRALDSARIAQTHVEERKAINEAQLLLRQKLNNEKLITQEKGNQLKAELEYTKWLLKEQSLGNQQDIKNQKLAERRAQLDLEREIRQEKDLQVRLEERDINRKRDLEIWKQKKLITEELKKQNAELKKASQTTKKMGGIIGTLTGIFERFGRVLSFRLYRMAANKVIQMAQEGIQALVEWDAAFSNNTSGALATMTEIKSTVDQLKRTFGALAMPIIQLVLPALRGVSQVLMFIANTVNQVVRAFQGETDYMKAVYVEISAVEDKTQSATGAIKELQRVLFGFDELNILPDENGNKGGTGLGALDGINNFEPTPINSKLQEVANKIKELFGPLFTKEFWEDIWTDIDTYLITPIGTALSFIWGRLKAYVINPVSGFVDALTTSLGYIGEIVGALFTPSRWSEIPTLLEQFPSKIEKTWTDYFKKVSKGIEDLNKKEIKPKTTFGAPVNINSVLESTQNKLNKKDLILPSEIKNPTNGKTVLTVTQSKVADFAAIAFKSSLKSISNTKTTRNTAQETANGLNTVEFKSKLRSIGNNKATRDASQKTVDGLATIGFKTKANSIVGSKSDSGWSTLWGNWNSAKSWLSSGSLPFKTSTTSVLGSKGDSNWGSLWGNWNAAKSWLSTGTLSFPTALAYTGLAGSLEWVWTKLQASLNNNPLEYTAKITSGSTSGNSFQGKTTIFADTKAEGGIVPNMGSLILAGEAGPEIVANLGNSTGVMNVKQMEAAVANGNIDVVNAVYAMANMIANAINDKDMSVNLDGNVIGKSATRYQRTQGMRGVFQ